ncbi:MAG: biotin synthase [Hydrogenophaga sp.]|uniref:biotin synthase n=1 Tax=Hydrogenophaga sp. TaxID=1904254 RepID=UPI0027207472|nr:biotin synthase [Hydrogenophaga sp.]MDO9146323.1 biotin synthase [Hydrogenophaga sp.]MDO9604666.1 biotin synthase [Hydrogenophaga sp.]MDP2163932.1 biotin synthase [Hydrogenophaga sp.]MDP3478095.1 biotin synthase [Hydrogenophaga sp.]
MNNLSEAETAVPGLDPQAALRWQQQPRTESPWLNEEVGSRMAERLQWFRDKPASWLHWEPVTGGLQAHQRVRAILAGAQCHVASVRLPQALAATREPPTPSWNPKHWLRGKVPAPFNEDTRVGMLWANMALHLEARPLALLRRWNAAIETNGFLMFSCLGPDTLRELRAVYARLGWPEPTHPFTDMHDWGDMLVHSGFAEPVMDMERITLSYSGARPLLQDLRLLGRNLHENRFSGLRARSWHAQLCAAIESGIPRSPDGRLLLTLEIIYGHAFKPKPRVKLDATTAVSMDDMRAMLRSGRR